MNVKSFQNDIGIAVNVDLDLVDVVGELPDGRTVLRFGTEWVTLGGPYVEIEPQVTAPNARRVPLPPPPPPAPPEEPATPAAGLPPAEPPAPPVPPQEDAPPHTEEPPPADNANNGGGETAAAVPENP